MTSDASAAYRRWAQAAARKREGKNFVLWIRCIRFREILKRAHR